MKRLVLLLVLFASAFAASSNIRGAISGLESTTRSLLLFSTVVFLGAGFVLAPAGLLVYLRKVKGAYKPSMMWKAVAFASAGIGIISLLAGLLGIIIYILTPNLINGLMAG
jgi:hypothetical protein